MRIAATLALAISAALPSSAAAWGSEGHRIASEITARRLDPRILAKVTSLLSGRTIAEASTWADEVRGLPPYEFSRPYHYVNIERGAEHYEEARDCAGGNCVTAAIAKYAALLRDPAASRRQRAEALKFLIHFVQDAHQPLHASRAGDRGGNDIPITFYGRAMNLHALWDTGLILRMERDWRKLGADLAGEITPERAAEWRSLDPIEWTNESYRLALDHAYPIGDGELGEAYYEKNRPVVEERLKQAGVRLALLLESIFAEEP